jgi:hypothetical protein
MVIATAAGDKARSLWLRPVERAVICSELQPGLSDSKKRALASLRLLSLFRATASGKIFLQISA